MELTGVDEFANRKFSTYSTGMKQRLAIASALLGNPEVVVLDEPTNGLDPEGIADVRALIGRIADDGTTVILASHLLDEVQKVCSHVCVLKKGKKLFDGQVGSLVAGKEGIEIGSDNLVNLGNVLSSFPGIYAMDKEKGQFLVKLKSEYKSAELSAFLISKGVDITHFAHRKGSLEKEFLQLLSNDDQ